MHLILPLSHPGLSWQSTLPPAFKGYRLPGGEVHSASGVFGTITIQQYIHPKFSIRLYTCHLQQAFIFLPRENNNCLRTFLSPDAKWKIQDDPSHALPVKKHHAAFINFASSPVTISFTPTAVTLFQVDFNETLIKELAENIGQPPAQLAKATVAVSTSAAGTDILAIIQSILHCTFDPVIRSYLFASKIAELLLYYYQLLLPAQQTHIAASEHDIQLIIEAERIINDDLTKHHRIQDLAKRLLISPATFKRLFKAQKGLAPFEYLIAQRMKLALSILESGALVKHAAALTGYKSNSFVKAFIKYYGRHPSEVNG
jgi:AraC-like DNA-binding protein